ncbi:pentapeptide repeat-containing protein [Azospirillum brasilense]|uniref:pentapeptide repeat-containing protein n=1 Tax=Azospirillum brasilense TaxID=192 RepID=UPI000E0C8509|nr:pentapeptide repeat-containing protein [Azospirillum brasilense]
MTVSVDRKKLSIALVKVVVDAIKLDIGGVVKGFADTATAFTKDGPGDPTAEDGARLLLQRGAYTAAIRSIQRFARQAPFLAAEADPREIEAELARHTAGTPLELTATAFSDPERWPALSEVLDAFAGWQRVCRVPEDHREAMLSAFREDFVLALAAELRDPSREADYRAMLAEVTRTTLLDGAAQRTLDWQAYRARLVEAVHRPLRSLDSEKIPRFSLHDLYVPLRASVGEPPAPGQRREDDPKIPIRWLDAELDGWIGRADARDTVRVLSGDPGAGKSSACAMLAARLARQGRRVLLVPLGRLNYRDDAGTALSRFLLDELGHVALDGIRGDRGPPLVLILDGLDELAKAGQGAQTLLGGFVGNLGHAWSEWNRDGLRVLLLLAGRPGAANAMEPIARADGARLHVLRFRIEDHRREWFDDKEVARLDQRSEWWKRFGRAEGLPVVLKEKSSHLDSLTEQPLLNWLVAQLLTLEGEERAATIDDVHDLYTRLFGHVLTRFHRRGENAPPEAMDALGRDDLERMLEEVAVAAWHAGGYRTVPFPVVRKRLGNAGLDGHLDRLTDKRDEALASLLDSFFCRAHAGQEHRAVEFTHKSFGQFLTARRIAHEVTAIHRRLGPDGDRDDVLGALRRWLALCGPAVMDRDLLDFLRAEVVCRAKKNAEDAAGWRHTLVRLFDDCVRVGMPLPEGSFRAREAERRVRNAEVALLATLDATVSATLAPSERSIIRLEPEGMENSKLAITTLHRLLGPVADWSIARFCLSCLNLTGADLTGADLWGANLTDADLMRANLTDADLMRANLTGADLRGANLTGADLRRANLTDADLTGADLTGADLRGANLRGANLTGADLTGADLTGADLRRANLMRAKLTDANLTGADLTGADLWGANLMRANLTDANLTGADLTDADLTGADLTDADLTDADLMRADLTDANLTDADLTGANLTDAKNLTLARNLPTAPAVHESPK